MTAQENRFITYLTGLSDSRRGELAVLRRGLGQPPGCDVNMYPYIARFVPDSERGTWCERNYYLVAALFAYHPMNTSEGNFGSHMRAAAAEKNIEATERRFTVLLSAHPDDLPDYLRQAVSFLKSREIPVNWDGLFRDLKNWGHADRFIQRRWADSFWGYIPPQDETANQ